MGIRIAWWVGERGEHRIPAISTNLHERSVNDSTAMKKSITHSKKQLTSHPWKIFAASWCATDDDRFVNLEASCDEWQVCWTHQLCMDDAPCRGLLIYFRLPLPPRHLELPIANASPRPEAPPALARAGMGGGGVCFRYGQFVMHSIVMTHTVALLTILVYP